MHKKNESTPNGHFFYMFVFVVVVAFLPCCLLLVFFVFVFHSGSSISRLARGLTTAGESMLCGDAGDRSLRRRAGVVAAGDRVGIAVAGTLGGGESLSARRCRGPGLPLLYA
jgi:hypothetical protein